MLLISLLVSLLCSQSFVRADVSEGVQVAKTLSLKDVKVSILNADGTTVSSDLATYPKTLLSETGLTATQVIEVTLTVLAGGEGFKAEQVMLMAKPIAGPTGAYAIGKTKKGGVYTITIGAPIMDQQNVKQGGVCEVTLLVGDSSIAQGLTWSLGTISIPASSDAAKAPKTKTASTQPADNSKPLIHHVHRPHYTQPPVFISLVFTVLSFAPLAITICGAFAIGANFKGLPLDSSSFLYVVLFHGSIAAMLVLYFIFWLGLDLAQTLLFAGALGIVVVLSGYKALSTLASARLKKD